MVWIIVRFFSFRHLSEIQIQPVYYIIFLVQKAGQICTAKHRQRLFNFLRALHVVQ